MGSQIIYEEVMKRIDPKILFTNIVIDDHVGNFHFYGSYKVKMNRFNAETTVSLCNNIDNNVMEGMRKDAGLSQKEYYKTPF